MKTVSSIANEKGGVTLLLFHCYFNASESLTHYMHDLDHSLYSELPYLYSVCIADNSTNNKKITAAFSIKTTYHHDDPDFINVLTNVVSIDQGLLSHLNDKTTFLPARINVSGQPLTEKEHLQVSVQQFMKHNVDGRA